MAPVVVPVVEQERGARGAAQEPNEIETGTVNKKTWRKLSDNITLLKLC
jgi:hypothetical protein